ncbi:glycosyltransferase family 2 protein [Microbacterium terricola]|uniref:Uncharacterized protein n=1 Tax=Microbacterium terricola TaxID=344163 RepID=A0ABM8DWZ7_9MICO|nr:glycosyltransferase family 2 protein [Microbacterium terricola]UYK39250.1 glycosyltransferase [Microbacterium terricola]BDV30030.1 hypothetical protein Microterr_06900 [Microbacterium terricola]
MPVAVSVVVPVYNPGEYLRPLLDSLDRQILDGIRVEAIFVDDGSTDGTAELLDEWCSGRPDAAVIHQENHGWPGQPRNVGIEQARGEYIQFVDQDDWLGDEALQRLYDYARANHSDVVIGKMVGIRRSVPTVLFRRSVPRARIGTDSVQNSQTPHKMFRRAFLDEIGLRFPEGRHRLEDHVFVTTAYLRAEVISIYADYDCYFHISRDDGRNAGFSPYDPVDYYGVVDHVLDIVESLLPAGPERDAFMARWLRVELIGRLYTPLFRDQPRPRRQAFYDEIQRIVRTHYAAPGPPATRSRTRIGAAMVRHLSIDEFAAADRALEKVTVRAWLDGDGVGVRLLSGGRELAPSSTVSEILAELLPAHLRAEVLADLGDDADRAILPGVLTLVAAGAETHLERDGEIYRHRGTAPRAGDHVRIGLRIGVRDVEIGTSARPSVRSVATAAASATARAHRVLRVRTGAWLRRRNRGR